MRANEFFELMDYNKKMKYSSGDVMRIMEAYKEHCFKVENLHISNVSSSKNYSWECGNFTRKVKAKNIRDGLIKSVKDFYDARNYPSKNSIRLDIYVVEE